jgi:hypothetical protein
LSYRSEKLFFVLFLVLWGAAIVGSHKLGRELLATADAVRALGPEAETIPQELHDRLAARGTGLLLLNFPLFIASGPLARTPDADETILFRLLTLLGCVYVPGFVTICLYFLFHAPGQSGTGVAVEWEEDELDEKDRRNGR